MIKIDLSDKPLEPPPPERPWLKWVYIALGAVAIGGGGLWVAHGLGVLK